MNVIGFVEGARTDSGGAGIVAAPIMLDALAKRGHHSVLIVCGQAMPSAEPFLCSDAASVLHAQEPAAFCVVAFPAWGRWQFVPSLFPALDRYIAEVDFIALHSLYSFPVLAGYLLARRYHKPYGLWLHGVLAPFQREVNRVHKRTYDGIVARRILNEASALFFSALGERDETSALKLRAPSVVIPNGFNAQDYANLPPRGQFRTRYLSHHDGPLVMYLGRLNAKKGLDLLVKAMAEVVKHIPDARLAICGGGDPVLFKDQVEKWINECGLEGHAVLTGYLDDEYKQAALADADLFVLPSQAENFGVAIFEAMASRIPVVISDSLNYADEVRCAQAGLIVKRESHEIATAILTLLNDEELRKTMGANGLRLASRYSWATYGEKLESAIECILKRQPFPEDLLPA